MDGDNMQLKSSFILLEGEDKNHFDKIKVNELILTKNIYSYIEEAFPDKVTLESNEHLIKRVYIINTELPSIDSIKIQINDVVNVSYVDIIVVGKSEPELVSVLEDVQNKLFNLGMNKRYITIISYDAVSEYYCNMIFPKLNTMERNLRKLLFNVYTMNFGKNYYK